MAGEIQPIVMPKWGLAMEEGVVTAWNVAEGATVTKGQEIADIETSKIANVFESPVAGTLRKLVAQTGETLPVGALLAVVADKSVGDTELDAYIAKFNEALIAALAAKASEKKAEPETVEIAGGRKIRYLSSAMPMVRRSCSCMASAATSTTGCSTRRRWPSTTPPMPSTCRAMAAPARTSAPATSPA
jgi:pyruvate/2-oxoglutarate dehydrogenase complex dihydrolipoamide acyltransferase (E2) component